MKIFNALFVFQLALATGSFGVGMAQAQPANDQFENATPLTIPASVEGTTIGATKQSLEPDVHNATQDHTIWYRWDSPATIGTATFSLRVYSTPTFSYSHYITVFQAGSSNSITGLQYIGGLKVDGGELSTNQFAASSNTSYYIRVSTYGSDSPSPVQVGLGWEPIDTWSDYYAQAEQALDYYAQRGQPNLGNAYYTLYNYLGDAAYHEAHEELPEAYLDEYFGYAYFYFYALSEYGAYEDAANYYYYYLGYAYFLYYSAYDDTASANYYFNYYNDFITGSL